MCTSLIIFHLLYGCVDVEKCNKYIKQDDLLRLSSFLGRLFLCIMPICSGNDRANKTENSSKKNNKHLQNI